MTEIHERLRALLDEHGAVYRVVEHEPEGRSELIARIRGNRLEQAIKSMVVQARFGKQDSRYYLANVPANCRVDLEAIKTQFEATRVAIAPREKAEALAGCPIGAVPPFSFNDGLIVLADPRIEENEEVVFNAGRLDRSIFMKSSDYLRIAKPQVGKFALQG
jgi:Ala-tRNA(Pro) deacylase